MKDNVFYLTARDAIVEFLEDEYPTFPKKLQSEFMSFFSELSKYEEEGQKISPSIIFTSSVDAIIRHIPNTYKIPIFTDSSEVLFSSRMKSLIPFCLKDWTVYVHVNEKEEKITYGFIKTFNSIKEKDLLKLIFETEALSERKDKLNIFSVESVTTYVVVLKSLKGKELNVNFSLNLDKEFNWGEVIKDFVNASFSKLRTTEKKLNQIKIMYENVFKNVFKSIDGAICVVVDKEYVDNGFFSDGIWLKDPISFSKLFLQSKSYSEQKLISFCDVFMGMLNHDGITIVDNTGTIRAYNVFVETNISRVQNISGGARKRAAYTVAYSRRKRIMGVYFQSQDGEVFYKSVK